MKKQSFENGTLKDRARAAPRDKFLERLENITSAVDFYNMKSEIISRLKNVRK